MRYALAIMRSCLFYQPLFWNALILTFMFTLPSVDLRSKSFSLFSQNTLTWASSIMSSFRGSSSFTYKTGRSSNWFDEQEEQYSNQTLAGQRLCRILRAEALLGKEGRNKNCPVSERTKRGDRRSSE